MSGFTKEELMHYKSVLHSNVLVGIATLIDMAPKLGFTINPALQVCTITYCFLGIFFFAAIFIGARAKGRVTLSRSSLSLYIHVFILL